MEGERPKSNVSLSLLISAIHFQVSYNGAAGIQLSPLAPTSYLNVPSLQECNLVSRKAQLWVPWEVPKPAFFGGVWNELSLHSSHPSDFSGVCSPFFVPIWGWAAFKQDTSQIKCYRHGVPFKLLLNEMSRLTHAAFLKK